MAALVAGALAQVGDRPARLVAILADRYRSAPVLLAAALAQLVAGGLAAAGGALHAPQLTPEAKRLLLALALLLQGGGALLPVKAPERLERWRLGAFGTAFLGLFILFFGGGLQFIVAALAARSPAPWFAAVGATVGALAVLTPAAVLGEEGWTTLPLVAVRRVVGAAFILTGLVIGLGALRLL